MRTGVTISVSAADRRRLEAIVADRNTVQKHAWRVRIVLLTADSVGTNAIMTATGKSKTTVWRWQARFAEAGVDGLLEDKTRPPGKAPIGDGRVVDLVRLTHEPPPHEATHWTARAMAKAAGLGVATVQKIWKAHGLAPHRWRAFKLSRDPAFAEKLHAIVGLYVSPPAHAVVLSVDEKSQIQALDRTQPGLPLKKGRGATMTHDYKRNGTTTLFAALNVLDGTVCQTAFKIDPRSASKIAPLGRWLLARSERIGAGGEEEIGPGAFCAGRAQRRCLKRQLSLPVSTMSQWWVRRSSSAVVILASPKTDGHSPNAKFVVTITEVCS